MGTARQPFAGLFLAASAGIVLAELSPLPGLRWFALFLAGVLLLFPSSLGIYACTALAFAVFHQEDRNQSPHDPVVLELEGTALETPRQLSPERCQFPLRTTKTTGPLRKGDKILVSWKGKPPVCADTVHLIGSASAIRPPRNPGEFDFKGYLRRQHIEILLAVRNERDAQIVGHASAAHPKLVAAHIRAWMEQTLRKDLEDAPEISALISSMVLGANNQTPREIIQMFQKTGTLHLFAVSGLNVAMFAMILWTVLKPLGMRKARAAPVLAVTLFFYALLTGFSASALRAAIMGSLVLIGLWIDRKPLPLNILCAAGFLILLTNTEELFSPGFQLSFGVVASILAFAGVIESGLAKRTVVDPFLPLELQTPKQRLLGSLGSKFSTLVGVSTAAWIGSLPFTLYHFHMVSPLAVATNLVVVPMAFVVLALAMLALGSAFIPGLTATFNNANWLVAKTILGVVSFSASLPGNCFYLASPVDRRAELVVFDFGQGGAALIDSPEGRWLFDCGRLADFQKVVTPALHQRGVMSLDGLLLTHGDVSHIGGAADAVREFSPNWICTSSIADRSQTRRQLEQELFAKGLAKTFLAAGDRFGSFRVLYPPGDISSRNADDQALVVQSTVDGTRVIFTSDSGFLTEQWLLAHATELESEVLVKGEHSKDPCSEEFLRRVNPLLVISTADPFRTQQPAEPKGPWIYLRQDQTGAVTVRFGPHGFEARPFLDKTKVYTFTNRAR